MALPAVREGKPLPAFAIGESSLRDFVVPSSRRRFHNDRCDMTPHRTLFDKLWQRHVVLEDSGGLAMLYVDRHLVYSRRPFL